jgi:hypothetical protein
VHEYILDPLCFSYISGIVFMKLPFLIAVGSLTVSTAGLEITVSDESVSVTYPEAFIANIRFRKERAGGTTILQSPLARNLYQELVRYEYNPLVSDFQSKSMIEHFSTPSAEQGITNDIIGLSAAEDNTLTCKYRDGFEYGTLSIKGQKGDGISKNFITLPDRRRLCLRLHKLRLFVLDEMGILATYNDWDDNYMEKYVRYDHKEAYFSNDHRQGRVYASTTSMLSTEGFINVAIDTCPVQQFEVEDNTCHIVLKVAKALAQDANNLCGDNVEALVFKTAKRSTSMYENIIHHSRSTINWLSGGIIKI